MTCGLMSLSTARAGINPSTTARPPANGSTSLRCRSGSQYLRRCCTCQRLPPAHFSGGATIFPPLDSAISAAIAALLVTGQIYHAAPDRIGHATASEQRSAFEAEEKSLRVEAAAKSHERPVAADHAMARNDDRKRIPAVRRADRANRVGLADRARQLSVTDRPAVRNLRQLAPHRLLERRARRRERQIEGSAFRREILFELTRRDPDDI